MKNKTKVFVTGGSGHLGANLILALLKKGYQVKALWRPGSSHPLLENKRFEKVPGDISNYPSLLNGMKGCTIVVHTAGYISYKKKDYNKLFQVNVTGTETVMAAALANDVRTFIHISSTAAVGFSRNPDILDEKTVFSRSFKRIGYMYTKHTAEEYVLAYKDRLRVISINPSTILGKGDNHFNTGEVIRNIVQGKIRVAPPGMNSFVDAGDVVHAILLSFNRGRSGERYIISGGNRSFQDFFNLIAELTHRPQIKKVLPVFLVFFLFPLAVILESLIDLFHINSSLTANIIRISFSSRCFTSRKAEKELGWRPVKKLKDSLREAIKYYQQQGKL